MARILALFFLADTVTVGALMYLPVLRGAEVFFGVRVEEEFYRGAGRRILYGYWFWCVLMLLTTQAVGLGAAWSGFWPWESQILPRLLLVAAIFCLYTVYYRRVKPYALPETGHRFASSLRVRCLGDYTSLPLEAALIVLTIVPLAALIWFYPELPAQIPVHWGFDGRPDRWEAKRFGTVFLLPVLLIYMQGLMLLLKAGVLRSKMTLPAENTETYLRLKEDFLGATVRLLDWTRVAMTMVLSAVMLLLPVTTLARLAWLKVPVWMLIVGTTILMLAASIVSIARLWRIDRELKAATGRVYVQRPQDAAHWYAGGLFYYNPADPSVMVEKLTGLGYTCNMGNKLTWLYLAYFALLPVLLIWMLSAF